tara:strand:- start:1594 stop:2826 length:1233 start_codon:yes stop_codon:yes gene_type:complete
MISEDLTGIIELGNIKIKCLIFKIKSDGTAEILSSSITPSDGIHNDVIVNLTKASNAIRTCISQAEKKIKVSLKKINIVFEQPEFLCTKFSKHKKIDGSKIDKADIEFLLSEAKKQLILNDKNQSIIHIFNHNYIVDKKNFIEEPIGVYADTLFHEMTFISAPKNNLKNIRQVFMDCDLEVEKLISRTFALGIKVLNNNDFNNGAVLINLDFEKISLGLFKNLALVHSITIPIGTNHISKDISKVCSLDLEESDLILRNIDFSLENNQNIFDENNYLKKEFFINSSIRKVSKKLILDIVKARLDEIFNKLKKQLIIPSFKLNSLISYFILAEDSKFENIEKYSKNFFGTNLKRIDKNDYENESNLEKNFVSSLGALKLIKDGWETEAIPEIGEKTVKKMGIISKIFRNFK